MARPFKNELQELRTTAQFVDDFDRTNLLASLKSGWSEPLLAVGSGGSFTSAFAMAKFHRHFAGQMSIATTPYELASEPMSQRFRTWLFSAGGRNVDIRNAVGHLATRDYRHIHLVTARDGSPLTRDIQSLPSSTSHVIKPPLGKDGFLATNSLLAAILGTGLAYSELAGEDHRDLAKTTADLLASSNWTDQYQEATQDLWDRPYLIVLHGAATSVGAIDMESKFTEAALGACLISDFRNFAHGRHHWLAKRAEQTGVIALVGSKDKKSANATLKVLPSEIPVARFDFEGGFASEAVQSLLAAFYLSLASGRTQDIDPGQPGVPDFGRKLYGLKSAIQRPTPPSADERLIKQKVGRTIYPMLTDEQKQAWQLALDKFRELLARARFEGVILDYDGTIVDTRKRFEKPDDSISECLAWIAEHSALGIATGRGKSARDDLQSVIPEALWPNVWIGYYNGSVIGRLDDNTIPPKSDLAGEDLVAAARSLRADPWLSDHAHCEERETQITFTPNLGVQTNRVWRRVMALSQNLDGPKVKAYQSGHSVDVVAANTSKIALADKIGGGAMTNILTIGDRGAWPGNDCELLKTPHSLTVDACGASQTTCWPLAPNGLRGPQALEWILQHLSLEAGTLRLVIERQE